MANVGKNIRLIRKQKNMTQDTLAELLYVSRQTVSNYETGRSNPDIDMLVKIAEVLQTDVNILIFGFPVPLSRKREYIKLGIVAVFLMAFVFLFMRLSSWETVWRRDRFDLGLMFALHLLFRPALYLMGGWTVMQGISLLWRINRQSGRIFVAVYQGTVILSGIYLILTIPYCVMRLYVSWQMTRVSDFSAIPYFLPEFWQSAVLWIWMNILLKFSTGFFLLGFVLWNGQGERPGTSDGE